MGKLGPNHSSTSWIISVVYTAVLMAAATYPILAFCLGLEEGTMQAFLQAFSLNRALPFPLCSRSRWLLCCEEELGKLSGLMTLGMFFSPRCRALAMASDIILLAFSCLSCMFGSIWWCVLRGVLFSDEELDEDDDDEEEEEDDELLFIGGLRTRTWLPGPLAFFRGWGKQRERWLVCINYEANISDMMSSISDDTKPKIRCWAVCAIERLSETYRDDTWP